MPLEWMVCQSFGHCKDDEAASDNQRMDSQQISPVVALTQRLQQLKQDPALLRRVEKRPRRHAVVEVVHYVLARHQRSLFTQLNLDGGNIQHSTQRAKEKHTPLTMQASFRASPWQTFLVSAQDAPSLAEAAPSSPRVLHTP
jgi:hypothetical protein